MRPHSTNWYYQVLRSTWYRDTPCSWVLESCFEYVESTLFQNVQLVRRDTLHNTYNNIRIYLGWAIGNDCTYYVILQGVKNFPRHGGLNGFKITPTNNIIIFRVFLQEEKADCRAWVHQASSLSFKLVFCAPS